MFCIKSPIHEVVNYTFCDIVAKPVAFPGGRLAHPEGQNEEENK